MALLAASLLVFTALVWMLRNHTVWVLGLIVVLYVAIPGQADGIIVPFMHPGSYLTFILVAQLLLTRDRDEMAVLLRPMLLVVVAFGVILCLGTLDLLNPYKSDAQAVFSSLLRVFLAPFLLLPLTFLELRRRPSSMKVLRWILLSVGIAEAIIAIVQFQTDMDQWVFWRSYYELSYWWTEGFPLPLGTTGHPLQLAAYLSMCIPLLARLRSPVVAVAIGGLFLYSCALATGRVSTALAAAGIIFVLLWQGRRWVAASAAAVMAVGLGLQLWRSEGLVTLRAKIQDDQGSAKLREQALQWALEHMDEFVWYGYPGGHDLRGTGILRSSLENGYLIAGLSFGMVFAVSLLLVHVYAMVTPLFRTLRSAPEVLATSFVWVGFFASSSFMAFAIDGRAFWMLAGMAWAVAAPLKTAPNETESDQAETQEGAGMALVSSICRSEPSLGRADGS